MDYWIYYNINADWDVVLLIFVSRQIGESEEDAYDPSRVWQFLIEHFKKDPAIPRYFNLLVRSKSKSTRVVFMVLVLPSRNFGP